MLKKSSLKKIYLALFCLVLSFILYLFPKKDDNYINLTPNTSYNIKSAMDTIYVLNKNNLVSRIKVHLKDDKILDAISYLTYGATNSKMLPINFKPSIPKNTHVSDTKLENGNLTINFDKNFLNSNNMDRTLESLVYTLTSIRGINSISILVEGKRLDKIPNTNIYLDEKLDRSYGINKRYDINSLNNIAKTTIYYMSKDNSNNYYIPVTLINNDTSPKIEIIIKELTSSLSYSPDLMSYLNSDTKLKNYELASKTLSLDFNNAILDDFKNNKILEEVTYAINLSIKDNYDVHSVLYMVDNQKYATFDLKDLE